MTKFNILGAGMFTGVSVMLYPIAVVKTRLQVASHDAVERNAYSIIKGLLKSDGIFGLTIGSLPARILFLTTLEKAKEASFKMIEPLRLSQPTQSAVANGVAGMLASACSQAVLTPTDVVYYSSNDYFSFSNLPSYVSLRDYSEQCAPMTH